MNKDERLKWKFLIIQDNKFSQFKLLYHQAQIQCRRVNNFYQYLDDTVSFASGLK